MLFEVNGLTAFTAGVVSFLSPCLLPLIPAYIMYLTGSFDSTGKTQLKKTLVQTLSFILGFTLVFMLLGISASALGQVFSRHKLLLAKISGLFIIAFGIHMTGLVKIPFLSRDYRQNKPLKKTNMLSAIGMGMAFAFGWTPCFGPVLGAILASTAAFSNHVIDGVIMLGIYSLGMAIPFLITALFIGFFDQYIVKISRHTEWLNRVAGFVMIVFGILMLTGKLTIIANFLLNLIG